MQLLTQLIQNFSYEFEIATLRGSPTLLRNKFQTSLSVIDDANVDSRVAIEIANRRESGIPVCVRVHDSIVARGVKHRTMPRGENRRSDSCRRTNEPRKAKHELLIKCINK